jgi:hypothetical protein
MPVFFLLHAANSEYGYALNSINKMLIFNSASIFIILLIAVFSFNLFEKHFVSRAQQYKYN